MDLMTFLLMTSSTRNLFKLSMTVFVGCPEGCWYHTASAVYDLVFFILLSAALRSNAPIMFYLCLFFIFFIHRSFSETTRPDSHQKTARICSKFQGMTHIFDYNI